MTLLLCKTWAFISYCFVHQHGRLITWLKTIYWQAELVHREERYTFTSVTKLFSNNNSNNLGQSSSSLQRPRTSEKAPQRPDVYYKFSSVGPSAARALTFPFDIRLPSWIKIPHPLSNVICKTINYSWGCKLIPAQYSDHMYTTVNPNTNQLNY